MYKISKISVQVNDPERVSIFINNQFCCGLTKIELESLNLIVNSEISCYELNQRYEKWRKHRIPENLERSDLNAKLIADWIKMFWAKGFYFRPIEK